MVGWILACLGSGLITVVIWHGFLERRLDGRSFFVRSFPVLLWMNGALIIQPILAMALSTQLHGVAIVKLIGALGAAPILFAWVQGWSLWSSRVPNHIRRGIWRLSIVGALLWWAFVGTLIARFGRQEGWEDIAGAFIFPIALFLLGLPIIGGLAWWAFCFARAVALWVGRGFRRDHQ